MHLMKSFYPLKFVKSGQKATVFTLWGIQGRLVYQGGSQQHQGTPGQRKEGNTDAILF